MYKTTHRLILKSGEIPTRDVILGLRGTKALNVSMFPLELNTEVTTWSSLVRTVVSWLQEDLLKMIETIGEQKFIDKYVTTFNDKLRQTEIKLNSNCPVGIFKDNHIEDFMNSTVYLNNKNHKLKLFDYDGHSWNVCAVYTGEIIFVLSTLISILDDFICTSAIQKTPINIPDPLEIKIDFVDRKDLKNIELEEVDLDNISVDENINVSSIKNAIVVAYAGCKSVEAQLINICNMLNIDTDFME